MFNRPLPPAQFITTFINTVSHLFLFEGTHRLQIGGSSVGVDELPKVKNKEKNNAQEDR